MGTALAGPDLTAARIYRNQGDLAKAIQFYGQEIEKNPKSYIAIFERGKVYGMVAMDRTKKGVQRDLAGESDNPQKSVLQMMVTDFDAVRGYTEKKARKKVKPMNGIINDNWAKFYNDAVEADKKHAESIAFLDSLIVAGDTLRTEDGAESLTPFDSISTKNHAYEAKALGAVDIAMVLKPGEWNPLALKAQIIERTGQIASATEAWTVAKAAIEASDLSTKNKEEFTTSWRIIQLHRLQNNYSSDNNPGALEVANQILENCSEEGYEWSGFIETTVDGQVIDSFVSVEMTDLPEACQDALIFKAFSLTNMVNDPPDYEWSGEVETEIKTTTDNETTESEDSTQVWEDTEERKSERRKEAIIALRAAFDVTPDDSAILFYLGQFYLDGGDTTNALEWWNSYIEIDTEEYDVLFQVGYLYLKGGSFKDVKRAEEMFQLLVDRFPNECDAWINLGVAQIDQDKTETAAASITRGQDCKAAAGE
jgi:tetratricopeptide (TPR) repeat protein